MSREIWDPQGRGSAEARALLAALLATELLQPSRCLWLSSPRIPDLVLLDNSAGTFDQLSHWGTRPIRLSEILVTLLSPAQVVIATTADPANRPFLDRIRSLARDARRDHLLTVVMDEQAEVAVSIVADDFALVGSRPVPASGQDCLRLTMDPGFVAQAQDEAFKRMGGVR